MWLDHWRWRSILFNHGDLRSHGGKFGSFDHETSRVGDLSYVVGCADCSHLYDLVLTHGTLAESRGVLINQIEDEEDPTSCVCRTNLSLTFLVAEATMSSDY